MTINRRIAALEARHIDDSVVSIVTPRGGVIDAAEQERVRQRIEVLRKSGRTVYVANMARLLDSSAIAVEVP